MCYIIIAPDYTDWLSTYVFLEQAEQALPPLKDSFKQPSCSAWLHFCFSHLTVSKISRNFMNINKLVQNVS